jgi:hypothetical protein
VAEFVHIGAGGFVGVWPEVTIEAQNHDEVKCLVRALSKEGYVVRVRDGFRVEVGNGNPAVILSAVKTCLVKEEIDSVAIVLKTGRKAVLSR